jgi:cytochrome b561
MDSKEKLSFTTVLLHWGVGLAVVMIWAVGFYIAETESSGLLPLHKSFGMLLLPIILLRVYWRMKSGWLEPVRPFNKFEQLVSKTTHWFLLIAIVAMPLFGMLWQFSAGHGLFLFGIELVHPNFSVADPSKTVAISKFWRGIGSEGHEITAYLLITAIGLHVLAGLKHHFIDKDGSLLRMLGKKVS